MSTKLTEYEVRRKFMCEFIPPNNLRRESTKLTEYEVRRKFMCEFIPPNNLRRESA
jgi:hypothetical protein